MANFRILFQCWSFLFAKGPEYIEFSISFEISIISHGIGHSQDSQDFSTNVEHYQVYDCNTEMHEDWTKTLLVVDLFGLNVVLGSCTN